MTNKRKIVLYPGSFNPVHIGHTALASYVINNIDVDELWFIPSPQNPLKNSIDILPLDKRVEIVSIAIQEESKFRICNIEKDLPSPYYTIQTLRSLEAIYRDIEFQLLIGADSLLSIHKWYKGDQIINNYKILVYPRKGYDTDNLEKSYRNVTILTKAPIIEISSTDIRRAKKEGLSLKYFMPKPCLWELF